ncbi:hypothetical protein K438DRAFT_1777659 [Mycena galopus ATCC 62051]|nr:hypothetical protein K438DRAFT_1777659 [Mycena galopus ATCC 62051]
MSFASSLLDKLNAAIPAPLAQFDAFPKVPSTYKLRSDQRGFLTLFVRFITFLLMLIDIGEFVLGWPDHEFSVDARQFVSVDLRDAVGNHLFLSSTAASCRGRVPGTPQTIGIRCDSDKFDVGQAMALKEHTNLLSARQVVAQSRKSRGFFMTLFQWTSRAVLSKVQARARRGRMSHQQAGRGQEDYCEPAHHNARARVLKPQTWSITMMNLFHVITEFSFEPYFPDITHPLGNSLEVTHKPFIVYQYFHPSPGFQG